MANSLTKQATHTPGPWTVFRAQARSKWSVRTAAGRYVAANIYEGDDASLIAAAPDQHVALKAILDRYVSLVNCGDCGNWDPEQEPEVIAARAAIAKAEGQ